MENITNLKAKEALLINIKALMTHYDMSYQDLGDKMGVSKQQVSNLINGDSWIGLNSLESLAKAFKINETDLFNPEFSKKLTKLK